MSNISNSALFPVICGPTAGGKTLLAVAVAQSLATAGAPGEVISADAYQIYRSMNIGTAKPPVDERAGVPHHLIDVVDPTEAFTVHDWLSEANRGIDEIRARGGTPVVVGGTHLYVKALLEGLFEGPSPDESLRDELRGVGLPALRAELERVDPDAARRIHPNDDRRTVRALEVFRQTGKPITELQQQWDREKATRPDALLIGLDWPAESINRRINARVKSMIDEGLRDEVEALHEANQLGPQAREALGYKQIIDHLEGRCSLDEAIERIKIETRRFAKNQRTWIRRLRTTPGSVWLTPDDLNDPGLAARLAHACGPSCE
ncbi:MAG: tRNA (adenosine(37)-N6)-dimethylallyltransferase MiaA [Planctomycetota bacterium]